MHVSTQLRRLLGAGATARRPGAFVPVSALALGVLLTVSACSSSPKTSSGGSDKVSIPAQATDATLRNLLPAKIRESGVLRVGTTTGNAPMDFATADGKPQGVDIDLSAAAAQLLGLKVTYTETQFSGLIAGQLADRFDVIWGAMNDNALREKQVTFVNYFKHGFSVLVAKGNPHKVNSPADFCGLDFAEAQGSVFQTLIPQLSQDNCVARGKPAIKISIYPDNQGTYQALSTNRVDAIMAAQEQVTYQGDLSDQLEPVPNIDLKPVQYGIGITPSNTALIAAIKATVEKMIANGTYAAILKRWNLQSQGITNATINHPAVS